ncbi:MAG TPA: hypothetical protein VJ770_18595, partial [Stellaceae bacterium]|nr:hypothetical protein [Stellaceae bacterium]
IAAVGGSVVGGSAAPALAAGLSGALFAIGAATALASVLSYGLIATAKAKADWTLIALRAGASWIAAIGVMIFAFASTQLLGHS